MMGPFLAKSFFQRAVYQTTMGMMLTGAGLGYAGDVMDMRNTVPHAQYPERDMSKVTTIVIHHTGTYGTGWGPIMRYHIEVRHWQYIGYHFGVSWDDRIAIFNDPERRTNHCRNCNSQSVGLALLGHYDDKFPYSGQKLSAESVVRFLMERYPTIKYIRCHSEMVNTICPGGHACEWVKQLRERIEDHPI